MGSDWARGGKGWAMDMLAEHAAESDAKTAHESSFGIDVTVTGHLAPSQFFEATKDPLPTDRLTAGQAKLWTHIVSGVVDVIAGDRHGSSAPPREQPFAGVGHALSVMLYYRIDGFPMKSSSAPSRFERAPRAMGGAARPDMAARAAEELDPIERAWRLAYSGPWMDGGDAKVSERMCREWLLLRYVAGWTPGAIDADAHESAAGAKLVGRVTRAGRDRVQRYLEDRGIIPEQRRDAKWSLMVSYERADLVGLDAIAAHLDRSTATIRRWIRDRGLPVRVFVGSGVPRYEAHSEELDEWMSANTSSPDDLPSVQGNGSI